MESSRDDFVIAIRSAFLKKENQQRFSLLSLIFFSIIFLILGSFNFKAMDYLKITIKEIVYKSTFIVSAPENFVKNTYVNISSHFNYHDDYEKIKNSLQVFKTKDLSKQIITFENIKLKKLIDDYFIKDNEIYAKVIIDRDSPFLKSVVLNKGSKHNIKLGMIVLDNTYLIGKIVEVNYLTSRVLLMSDINFKIPVSLQPIDMQAIMSGSGDLGGVIQYIQKSKIKNDNMEDLFVVSSGAGGLFKSGIPIGKILKQSDLDKKELKVDFYKDFSQLKYVRVVSHSKESINLDQSSKDEYKKTNDQLNMVNEQNRKFLILQKQKKIDDEIRTKLEKENKILKTKFIRSQNQLLSVEMNLKDLEIRTKNLKFLEMNILYGRKCKKNIFNNGYEISTPEYRKCVLNKGLKKN